MDDDLLMNFDPESNRIPILKPSLEDNLILLQTPVQKHLKVRFQTPARTPLSVIQPLDLCELTPEPSGSPKTNDEENWKERIEVVTKFDHEEYVNSARVFMEEIIENVVTCCNRINLQDHPPNLECKGISNHEDSNCVTIDKENTSPDAAFKSKKSKNTKKPEVERPPLTQAAESSIATVFTAKSSLRYPIDEQPSISEVYIEHCMPTSNKKQSALKTIYSIFEADELPEDLKKEAAKASQLCSKKNPGQTRDIQSRKAAKNSTQKSSSESAYSTKKVSGRPPAPENPPPEPPQSYEFVDSSKHYTSAELHQSQSQSTFEDDDFHDAHTLIERGFEFDLSFLESKGNSEISSDLRKQSLYLKFDPLVAGEAPAQTKRKVGRKSDIIDLNGHVGLPHFTEEPMKKKTETILAQPDLLCASPDTLAKASMLKTRCNLQPDTKSVSSRDSFKSVQQPNDMKEEIIELLKYTDADVENIKEPLIQQIKLLKEENDSHKEKIEQMQVVLQEFESTVVEMAEKFEVDKAILEKEKEELTAEQSKTISHLESVEKAYLELLQRSEQMKVGIGNYKVNEETYKNVISEYQTAQEDSQKRYQALKATMEEAEERINNDMTTERKEHRSQSAALKARCKCLENQAKSLQLQLDQKANENVELTKICDELIEQQQSSLASSYLDPQ